MKCGNCPFNRYESLDYICKTDKSFYRNDICRIKYKEAEKLYKLLNNCETNSKTRETAKIAFEKYFKYYKELEKRYERKN